jgi:hypothetical protein
LEEAFEPEPEIVAPKVKFKGQRIVLEADPAVKQAKAEETEANKLFKQRAAIEKQLASLQRAAPRSAESAQQVIKLRAELKKRAGELEQQQQKEFQTMRQRAQDVLVSTGVLREGDRVLREGDTIASNMYLRGSDAGETIFDTSDFERDQTLKYKNQIATQFTNPETKKPYKNWTELPEELQAKATAKAQGMAVRDVAKVLTVGTGRGMVFTSDDEKRITRLLNELPPGVGGLVAPFIRNPKFELSKTGTQLKQEDNLAYINRTFPLTQLGARIETYAKSDSPNAFARGEYGEAWEEGINAFFGATPELQRQMIENLREDRNIPSQFGTAYREAAAAADASEFVQAAAYRTGVLIGFAGTLVEPDPFSLSLAGLAKTSRFVKQQRQWTDAAKNIEVVIGKPGATLADGLAVVKKTPGLEQYAKAKVGVTFKVSEGVVDELSKARQSAVRAQAAASEIKGPGAEAAQAEVMKKRLEAVAIERRLAEVEIGKLEGGMSEIELLRARDAQRVASAEAAVDAARKTVDDFAERSGLHDAVDELAAIRKELTDSKSSLKTTTQALNGVLRAKTVRLAELEKTINDAARTGRRADLQKAAEELRALRTDGGHPLNQALRQARTSNKTAKATFNKADKVLRAKAKAIAPQYRRLSELTGDMLEKQGLTKQIRNSVRVMGIDPAKIPVRIRRQVAEASKRLASAQSRELALVNFLKSQGKGAEAAALVNKAAKKTSVSLAEEGWKDVFRDIAKQLREGKEGLHDLRLRSRFKATREELQGGLAPEAKFVDITEGGTDLRMLDGGRVLNPTKLRQSLVETYGEEVVELAVRRGGQEADALRSVLSRDLPVKVSQADVRKIQEFKPLLDEARFEAGPRAQSVGLVRALETAVQDPKARRASVMGEVGRTFRRLLHELDPIKSRMGVAKLEVQNVLKETSWSMSEFGQDLGLVVSRNIDEAEISVHIREAMGPRLGVDVSTRQGRSLAAVIHLVDSKTPMKIGGRATFSNSTMGSLTKFSKAKIHLLSEGGGGAAHSTLANMWTPIGLPVSAEKATALRQAVVDNLQASETFVGLAERMRASTSEILGTVIDDAAPAILRGANSVAHAGIIFDSSRTLTKSIGGYFRQGQAADLNRFITGDWEKIDNLDSALSAVNRMGQPLTMKDVNVGAMGGNMGRLSAQIHKIGTDESGEAFFATQALARNLDLELTAAIQGINKSYEKFELTFSALTGGASKTFLQMWKTSVTSGLYHPNPRHYMGNYVGFAHQVWFSENLKRAAQVSFDGIPGYFPYAGPRFQAWGAEVAKRHNGNALGPMLAAVFNPRLSDVMMGNPGRLITKNGQVFTYEEMRTHIKRRGVMAAQATEEVMEHFSKSVPQRWKRLVGLLPEEFARFGANIEQRQRAALFLRLVDDGADLEVAAARVRAAGYDWKHAVTKKEVQTLAKWAGFWRYQRSALQQTLRAITEPITHADEVWLAAQRGDSKFARGHQAHVATGAFPGFIHPNDVEERKNNVFFLDRNAMALKPSYLPYSRPYWGLMETQQGEWEFLRKAKGREFSHKLTMGPPSGVLDSAEIWATLIGGLMTTAAVISDGEKSLSPDFDEQMFQPFLDMAPPVQKEILRGAAPLAGLDLGYTGWDRPFVNITPGEAEILKTIPFATVDNDPETGVNQTTAMTRFWFRATPYVGSQLPKLFDQAWYLNTGREQGVVEGMGFFFQNWGLGFKDVFFDPATDPEMDARKRERFLRTLIKQEKVRASHEEEP